MKKTSLFMLMIMIFSLLSSCKSGLSVTKNLNDTEAKREEVRLSLENAASFNPYKEKNPKNLKIFGLIYEPLFTYGDELKTVPLLAESFKVSDEGKSITVKLKDNVIWHNGDELSANDVIYTVNLILTSDSLYSNGIIEKAEVIDKKTVKISFVKPQINAPEKLMFPIVKSNVEEITGTGPFKFEGKENSDTYSFSRFEAYHGEKVETTYIKMINCPDINAVERMFDIGETDILMDYPIFNVSDEIEVFDYPTNKLFYIGINVDSSVFSGESTRQALLYIPDKKEISEKVMYKRVLSTDFPINPKSFLYPEELAIKKDDGYRETLLLKDRWTRVNGVFSRVIGEEIQEFKVNMLVKDTEEMKMISRVIEKNFDNFGIECDVLIKPETEFYEDIKNKNYDLILENITLSGSSDFEALMGERNRELIKKIKAQPDEEELKALYFEVCSALLKDVQFIPLFFCKDANLAKNYVSEDIILRLMR